MKSEKQIKEHMEMLRNGLTKKLKLKYNEAAYWDAIVIDTLKWVLSEEDWYNVEGVVDKED